MKLTLVLRSGPAGLWQQRSGREATTDALRRGSGGGGGGGGSGGGGGQRSTHAVLNGFKRRRAVGQCDISAAAGVVLLLMILTVVGLFKKANYTHPKPRALNNKSPSDNPKTTCKIIA